jgi:hypothetical protein
VGGKTGVLVGVFVIGGAIVADSPAHANAPKTSKMQAATNLTLNNDTVFIAVPPVTSRNKDRTSDPDHRVDDLFASYYARFSP